tara:strand:- start:230 stop:1783 length:1554 start_codon:yes stop_codon:yes gene_type:complete
MNSPWLSETCSEGAASAILLGPLEKSVLSVQAKSYSKGILWIAPPTEHLSSSYPNNVHCLDRRTESNKLSETIDEFLRLDYDAPPTVKVSSRVAEDDETAYTPILDLVISSIDSTLRARRTRSDTGILRQEQVFRNLSGYLRSRIPEKWRDSAQGHLVVVVGAGPSLDITLPLIKEGFPKPIVVAADSSLKALKSTGINPDFVVSIDPVKSHDSCTFKDHCPGIAILSSQSHSSWSQRWGENVRYLSGRVMTEDWLAAKGIPKTSLLAVNNAGLAAMLVADFLGPSVILMVGMDLSGGEQGSNRYAENTGRSHVQIHSSVCHDIPGNHTETVSTPFLSDWSETSETCARISSVRNVINLNDRGALLEGSIIIHPSQIEELREALSESLAPYSHHIDTFSERRNISGQGLDQVLSLLATRCDEAWKNLRPLLAKENTTAQEKLRFLQELLGNQDIAALIGDYSFAVMPEVGPGKQPNSDKLDLRIKELQGILWLLEDALVEAKPSDEFLTRLLTETFA